jgi:peptidoglycan/LPS O-acetylase OafA/YrhL
METKSNRLHSLDGLRGVSVSLVLLGHCVGTNGFLIPASVGPIHHLGTLGVRMFFILSGFLITTLLLKELKATGRIGLGRFYYMRTLRIFPAYFFLVVGLAILGAVGWVQVTQADLLRAMTFTSNYYQERSWAVGHTWSTGVQEQFYLMWPALLLWVGKRRALWVALAFVLAAPFIRLAILFWYPSAMEGVGVRFETIADAIALGCIWAGVRDRVRETRAYGLVLESRWFFVVPLIVFVASLFYDHPVVNWLFCYTIMNVGLAACIEWCVVHHSSRIGRFLNSGPVVQVGLISFSIYLWQQIFLDRTSTAWHNTFPANVVLALIVGVTSYVLIERPGMNLRTRLEKALFGARGRGAVKPDAPTPEMAPQASSAASAAGAVGGPA